MAAVYNYMYVVSTVIILGMVLVLTIQIGRSQLRSLSWSLMTLARILPCPKVGRCYMSNACFVCISRASALKLIY